MKIGLESTIQTALESNDLNTNFTRTNNKQSLASANCGVMQSGFPNCVVFWMGKSHVYTLKKSNHTEFTKCLCFTKYKGQFYNVVYILALQKISVNCI